MTELLEKAIKKVDRLSKSQQNAIAEIIMEEIEDERKWERKFKRSHSKLSKLADEAVDEYRKNKTEPLKL
jgi:NTP pyrophosphatase (non-canonical NTP hydrolase)